MADANLQSASEESALRVSREAPARKSGRRFLVASAIGVGCVVALAIFMFQRTTQSIRIQDANQYIELNERRLAGDERFDAVKLARNGESVTVGGFVASPEDANALREVLGTPNRSLKIDWNVKVFSLIDYQQAVKERAAQTRPASR